MSDLEAAAADDPQRDAGGEARDPIAGGGGEAERVGGVGDLLGVLAVDDGGRGFGEQALGEALLAGAVVAGGAQV